MKTSADFASDMKPNEAPKKVLIEPRILKDDMLNPREIVDPSSWLAPEEFKRIFNEV